MESEGLGLEMLNIGDMFPQMTDVLNVFSMGDDQLPEMDSGVEPETGGEYVEYQREPIYEEEHIQEEPPVYEQQEPAVDQEDQQQPDNQQQQQQQQAANQPLPQRPMGNQQYPRQQPVAYQQFQRPQPANQQYYQKPPQANQPQNYQRPPAAGNQQNYQRPPQANQPQNYQRPPAAGNQQYYQQPPATGNQQNYQRPAAAAANQQYYQRPPSPNQQYQPLMPNQQYSTSPTNQQYAAGKQQQYQPQPAGMKQGIPQYQAPQQQPVKLGVPLPPAPQNGTITQGAWSTDLFACIDDVPLWCVSLWCPCIAFGQVAEIVDKGTSTCSTTGSIYALILFLTGCQFIYSGSYRTKMRREYGIPGDDVEDFCTHLWCESCALVQEHKELILRGYDVSLGWHANMIIASQRQGQSVQMAPVAPNGMTR